MATRIVTARFSRFPGCTLAAIAAACMLASGCSVRLHGAQSSGTGSSATAASSHVSGATRFSGGRAAFSSGAPASPHASGGHVSLGKGPAVVLIVGLVIADAVEYFGSRMGFESKPESRTDSRTDSILETCSCYQKPVTGDQ